MKQNQTIINESMTINEISKIPSSQMKTYTKEEIIDSFKNKVHEIYSSNGNI